MLPIDFILSISMMNKITKQPVWWQTNLIWISVAIALLLLVIILLPRQNSIIIKIFRIVLGSVYILFLPWYWLTLSFFGKKEIDRLERFALSFALSISVVPLLTFYINLLWVKITQLSVWWVVAAVVVVNIVYLEWKKKREMGSRN